MPPSVGDLNRRVRLGVLNRRVRLGFCISCIIVYIKCFQHASIDVNEFNMYLTISLNISLFHRIDVMI